MTKVQKIIVSIVTIFCAIIVGCGTYFSIRMYMKNMIRFTINDTLPDGQGKKATVVLLGGQSNASGCSLDKYLQQKATPEKYAEYEQGYDNVFINYYCSGFNQSDAFVKCSTNQGEMDGYFGPELGIAEKLNELYPDETFFIIKCAWGGTDLYSQWAAPSTKGLTGDLYKQFVVFVENSLKYLESKHYDISIEGMCWMQGESDSFFVDTATDYELHLSNFIGDIRKKFKKYTAEDGMAFVDATIAANPVFWVYCDLVNASKIAVSKMSPLNVLIDTNAEGLITTEEPIDTPDIPHYDALSEIKLGHLFAEQLVRFF